tara:strand:- start:9835 stop:10398 length:564 start_codon:yes stop_codon:yes gene_type:complete
MADVEQLSRLLQATARGDQLAFAELYRATSSHLYGLLLRMLKRRDWAEEALQDCFIKIWQKAESFDGKKGSPLTWMLAVARYRALDLLRMKRPEVEMPDDDSEISLPPMTLADDTQDPLARSEETQGIDRMRAGLDQLPAEQRQAVLLAYYEGYTHQELATRLNAPLGTVKSWVRRGLARLRELLDE